MNKSIEYYKDLLVRFIGDEITPEEIRDLYTFIEKEPRQYEAIMQRDDIRRLAMEQSAHADASLSEEANLKLKERLLTYVGLHPEAESELRGRVRTFKKWYWIAASLIVMAGLGIYFYATNNKQQLPIAVITPKDIPAPATNRAMITLADGSLVFLDSVNNGQLAQMGNIKLIKLANGQIAYQSAGGKVLEELKYNTLTNPRGSKVIDMQLSDGSHVWLNAGSSITYPVAFVGKERKVELKGEGYFEVTKDPGKKFIVTTARGVNTEVLGTHFNVNAYEGESDIKVTLLEGSVKVSDNNLQHVIIKPGQQAVSSSDLGLRAISNVDLDAVTAWKNGLFQFQGASIEEVMRQLAIWYDLDVVYEKNVPNIDFGGKMQRSLSLKQVLSLLEKNGVKFKVDGRRITVLP